jgi:L-amino acid N-acyltransferase YncA
VNQKMKIRHAVEADAAEIARIWNIGIAERMATFETRPRTAADIHARLGSGAGPLLVAVGADGGVLGWAGLTRYSERPCYAGVADFSIYLDAPARGAGVGSALLQALIDEAAGRGYWKLLSRIFPENGPSRALCARLGFRDVGVHLRHACLDGSWRDVLVVERLIPENQGGRTAPSIPDPEAMQ